MMADLALIQIAWLKQAYGTTSGTGNLINNETVNGIVFSYAVNLSG